MTVCQASGCPLTAHPRSANALGGALDPRSVRLAADGLEVAPVERQGGEVERVEPQVGECLGRRFARPSPRELPVGQRDELEADAPEEERMAALGQLHGYAGERGTVGSAHGHRRRRHAVPHRGVRGVRAVLNELRIRRAAMRCPLRERSTS